MTLTPVITHFTPEQRPEWLAWRQRGIGGSDIPALCGLSKWASPTSVFYDKVGLLDDSDSDLEHLRWGRLLEPAITAEFEERTGLHCVNSQACISSVFNPWRRCTVDDLVAESTATSRHGDLLGVLEIKNDSSYGWDEIPDGYVVQTQWNLGVSAAGNQAWLAVLHSGRRLVIYEIPFDPGMFESLCAIADRFWEEHVVPKIAPPVDDSEATADALKTVYRDRAADGQVLELDDTERDLLIEWRTAKQHLAKAEARVTLAESRIRHLLAEATTAQYDGAALLTWKPQNRAGRLDEKAIRAAHPVLCRQFTGPDSTIRVLRPSKTLKQLSGETE